MQKDWTFTYTTGQALAAAVALFQTSEGYTSIEFVTLACDLAQHAMNRRQWVDEEGTLTARDEYPGKDNKPPWQNNDAVGFKSVLVRSLAKLYRAIEKEQLAQGNLQGVIRTFIYQQFDSLQTRNSNEEGQYGPYWAGPFTTPTSHSQLAVLDVMAAVYAVGVQ